MVALVIPLIVLPIAVLFMFVSAFFETYEPRPTAAKGIAHE